MEVTGSRWTYERPYFVVILTLRNAGEATVTRVDATVRIRDRVRDSVVARDSFTWDLNAPLRPGQETTLRALVRTPDLPQHLLRNFVSIDALIEEIRNVRGRKG